MTQTATPQTDAAAMTVNQARKLRRQVMKLDVVPGDVARKLEADRAAFGHAANVARAQVAELIAALQAIHMAEGQGGTAAATLTYVLDTARAALAKVQGGAR